MNKFINDLKNWLMQIGITPNLEGFNYIIAGVLLCAKNNQLITNFTTRLYPIIGLYYDKNTATIERGIRHAIQVSQDCKKLYNLNKITGISVLEKCEKPTASQLISILAEKSLMSVCSGIKI